MVFWNFFLWVLEDFYVFLFLCETMGSFLTRLEFYFFFLKVIEKVPGVSIELWANHRILQYRGDDISWNFLHSFCILMLILPLDSKNSTVPGASI
jgi:hypothetical protein